jgi:hypothetical protein
LLPNHSLKLTENTACFSPRDVSSPKDKTKISRWQLNASPHARASYLIQAPRRRQLSSGPLARRSNDSRNGSGVFKKLSWRLSMTKKLAYWISITLLCSASFGCSSSPNLLQIMDVQSTNCSYTGDFLAYENDTVRVVYIFWSENGTMGLFIHNKSKRPIYIDWKKCSYITGTVKHDYWDESVTITGAGASSTASASQSQAQSSTTTSIAGNYSSDSRTTYWPNFWDPQTYSKTSTSVEGTSSAKSTTRTSNLSSFLQSTFSYSLTRVTRSERITFIPPGATISRSLYNIVDKGLYPLPPNRTSKKDTSLLMPQKVSKGEYSYYTVMAKKVPFLVTLFERATSPISFRSFITYSSDEKFSFESYVDNDFFVARVLQLPFEALRAKPIGSSSDQNAYNMWASPSSFYLFMEH